MTATQVIDQIKSLPSREQKRVIRFVDELARQREDAIDQTIAREALQEPGDNVSWRELKSQLPWKK